MASSTFGIIEANGDVRSCEILDKKAGNVRDFDYDFMSLWGGSANKKNRKWIKDTKCNCHYDCAWSFNILSGPKYQVDLLKAALGLKR